MEHKKLNLHSIGRMWSTANEISKYFVIVKLSVYSHRGAYILLTYILILLILFLTNTSHYKTSFSYRNLVTF